LLPRVTAAITQFIKPIASAAKRTAIQDRPERDSQNQGFQRQSKAKLTLVTSNPAAPLQPTLPTQSSPRALTPLSVTQTFLQIVAFLKQGKGSILKWMGPRAYRATLQSQKKTGRFRKGAMINIKVE
jgi:hypothetical protein